MKLKTVFRRNWLILSLVVCRFVIVPAATLIPIPFHDNPFYEAFFAQSLSSEHMLEFFQELLALSFLVFILDEHHERQKETRKIRQELVHVLINKPRIDANLATQVHHLILETKIGDANITALLDKLHNRINLGEMKEAQDIFKKLESEVMRKLADS